jgi:hypothetical protein
MAKKAVKRTGKGKGGGGASPAARKAGSSKLLIFLTLVALVPFSLPTVLLLFVGMMPTIGIMLSDRTGNRYLWMCMGGLNFAGLCSWLLDLWFGHHDLDSAINFSTDLTMLACAYGAAACGWLLFLSIPPVILTFQTASMSRRAATLAASQKKLLELWGDDIRRVQDRDM